MKGILAEIIIGLLCVLALVAMACCQGCIVIWSDHVFVCTMFENVDANSIELIAESNYLQVGGVGKTTNDRFDVEVNPLTKTFKVKTEN